VQVSFAEERSRDVIGTQALDRPAVGDHGPLRRTINEHEDFSRGQRGIPRQMGLYAGPFQLGLQKLAEDIVADPPDEVRLDA
jgi:hypothetical protein